MEKDARICIIGNKGALGHAILVQLKFSGYKNIISCDLPDIDCTKQENVRKFFEKNQPEYVFFLAAISAGIEYKRKYPVEVMLKNLQMETNVLQFSHEYHCKRLLNVCSALLYPSSAKMPLEEKDITFINLNEVDTPYSLAKAAGLQLCQYYAHEYSDDFFTVIPCNFFGEYSVFDGEQAGVVPSLIRKIYEAKINHIPNVVVWGTGNAYREFLSSKDVANACIFLMNYPPEYPVINIGRGHEFTIRETAEIIKKVVDYKGELIFDASKPEGKLHMQLNIEKLFKMGWKPEMDLEQSIISTYQWYLSRFQKLP